MKRQMKNILFDASAIIASVLLSFIIICLSFSNSFKDVFSFLKKYIAMLSSGTLGLDASGRDVLPQLLFRFPRTLILVASAFILCSVFGIAAGMYFSYRSRNKARILHLFLTSTILSLPDILIIILLQSLMVLLNR